MRKKDEVVTTRFSKVRPKTEHERQSSRQWLCVLRIKRQKIKERSMIMLVIAFNVAFKKKWNKYLTSLKVACQGLLTVCKWSFLADEYSTQYILLSE